MDDRLLTVLLLLLGVSGPWGQGQEPEGPSEVLPEESSGEEVPKEDGILVLSHHTLSLALQEHPALMVEFYAPWCGHCKALAPEYSKAAALLAAESASVTLAKVDGPAEPELTKEFGVVGYPTLKFFQNGNRTNPEEYTGPQKAEGIAEWLRRRVGPSAKRLEDEEDVQALTDKWEVVVIGFFQDLQGEDVATFLALARDALDITFGFTDQPQLFQKFGLTKDTVILFKKFDEGRADFPVDKDTGLDLGDLSRFLVTHSMHLVTEFNSQTSPKIFAAKILNHLLLFVNKTLAQHRELLTDFREAAPPFRGQVLFVMVDVAADNDHVLNYFGLKAEEAPTLRLINVETTKKYAPTGLVPITAASVAAFCQAVLHGQVKPYLLSQEIPPDWDERPVKTLVGKNFEQVAFDETKNVFVKFYAPWCSHCKEMAPAWEALAEKYRDREDIVIAELDATANELEAFSVHGYPTLKFFPAGPDRKVIEYKSTRDLETFSKFLDSGGNLPEEEPKEPAISTPEIQDNSTVGPKEEL
ncbi:protein disulfide-isomerase A2 [Cricetulus griseus]|uniref:Protein disulfide-isomerase A2 n=1 Tax=Cricetulus griseus TaxID=10029 RepID=A0A8C2M6U8_CRIGR|nr:protein disulfide-isomerase A2 [Cricetulus griseus]XP_027280934.1 protein disulfide-isomerase A2 [Cricetulus griseus]